MSEWYFEAKGNDFKSIPCYGPSEPTLNPLCSAGILRHGKGDKMSRNSLWYLELPIKSPRCCLEHHNSTSFVPNKCVHARLFAFEKCRNVEVFPLKSWLPLGVAVGLPEYSMFRYSFSQNTIFVVCFVLFVVLVLFLFFMCVLLLLLGCVLWEVQNRGLLLFFFFFFVLVCLGFVLSLLFMDGGGGRDGIITFGN